MNTLIKKTVVLIAFIMSISSCTKMPYLVLYNNTNQTVGIQFKNYEGNGYPTLKAKTTLKFLYPSATKEITLISRERKLHYKIVWPPRELIDVKLSGKHIYLKIEENGDILLVKSAKWSDSEIEKSQPAGFPLKPYAISKLLKIE